MRNEKKKLTYSPRDINVSWVYFFAFLVIWPGTICYCPVVWLSFAPCRRPAVGVSSLVVVVVVKNIVVFLHENRRLGVEMVVVKERNSY
jgi:hypothetical protein